MEHDVPQDIPLDIRDSLNVVLRAIARDNPESLECLVYHKDTSVVSALDRLRQTPLFERFKAAFANAREALQKLKPKHRSGGALAGRIRSELGITQKRPNQAKASEKASRQAIAALKRKHKIQALHHLVRGELGALDPAIGDAACEMRPSFLLDIDRRVGEAFRTLGLTRAEVQGAIHRYDARHRSDQAPPAVRETGDIADDPDEAEDMALWDKLFDQLKAPGDAVDAGTYLQLCKSYTEASSLTLDEFGLPVASRLRRRHPLTAEVGDLEALGQATRDIMLRMADDIVEHNDRVSVLDPALGRELSAALRSCRAGKDVEGVRLPLLPIYEALYTVMTYEAIQERPLAFSTVYLTACNDGLRLAATDLEVLRPCGLDGQFEPSVGPVDEPMLTFRCLGITSGDPAPSPPPEIPFRCHTRDFVLAYAASHPPFAEGATVTASQGDTAASYILVGNAPSHGGVDRPLEPWFWRHRQLADRLGLHDFRFSDRIDRNIVRRTMMPVGLTPIHIHASTPGAERARLDRVAVDLDGDLVDPCFDLKGKASVRRSRNSAFA